MPDRNIDIVSLNLVEGKYELELKGYRVLDTPEKIFFTSREDFCSVVDVVLEYHLRCWRLMVEKSTRTSSEYSGAGSDRGSVKYPWMIRWELDLRCELPKVQKDILTNIVNVRNLNVSNLEENERLANLRLLR